MALQGFVYILDFCVICFILLKTVGAFFRCIKNGFFFLEKRLHLEQGKCKKRNTVESPVSYYSNLL